MSTQARFAGRDAVLALLLFVGIVAYLTDLPRTLGRADESHFLYEAKRIRDGEVIYRDFFQFVTPGAPYLMAGLFWLFGTTIDTARIGTAVLHAGTGVLMFAACRALGVGRWLALVPPLAFLAICQPAWQFASWHWFSTFFTVLTLFAMLRAPWAQRPRAALLPGLAAGLLMGVQQQKGLAVGLGAGAIFVLDHLADRRFTDAAAWRALAVRLLCFGAGVALIIVPLLLLFVGLAGFDPLFDALVRFPLVDYRKSFRTTWGKVLWITEGYAKYTYPVVLKYLPVVLLPAVLRVLVGLVRGIDRTTLRQLIVLILSGAAAALSIWYFPDFIHIAFIGPVYLVAAAEALHWAIGAITDRTRRAQQTDAAVPAAGGVRTPLSSALGAATALALMLLLGLHLRANAAVLKEQFRYPHDTAFGRIDFPVRWEPIMIDRARALLRESDSNLLFAYPNTSEPYLTTGGKNPTPYQYFFSHVSPKAHTERVLEILRTGKVPYIVCQGFFMRPKDPVAKEILEHYEMVDIPELAELGEFSTLTLYRRKDAPAAADGAAP
jgi:hypothetical protein